MIAAISYELFVSENIFCWKDLGVCYIDDAAAFDTQKRAHRRISRQLEGEELITQIWRPLSLGCSPGRRMRLVGKR